MTKKLNKLVQKNMDKQFKKMINDNMKKFLKSKFVGLESIIK